MKVVGTAAAVLVLIGSSAIAQDTKTGTITRIDRLDGTIAIQQRQDGTVGASDGGTVKQYKVRGPSLEELHAGDQVNFSATRAGDTDIVTRIEKKK